MARTGQPSQLAALKDIFDAQSPWDVEQGKTAPLSPDPSIPDPVIPGLGRFSIDAADLTVLARTVMPPDERAEFPQAPAYLIEMKGGAARIPNDKMLNPSHEVLRAVGIDLGERVAEIRTPKAYSPLEAVTTTFTIHCFRERHRGGRHAAEASSTYRFASDAQLVQLHDTTDVAERRRIIRGMLYLEEGQAARIGRASGMAWLPTFGEQGDRRIEGTDLYQTIARVSHGGALTLIDTSDYGTTELLLPDKR